MKINIPLKVLKMDGLGCHLFINVKFNSKIKGKVILDTGATKTVFDMNLLEEIIKNVHSPSELKSAGIEANMVESKVGTISSFKIGKLKLKDYEIILLNLENINQLYEKMYNIKIWGLIGGDFLLKYKARIDYRKRMLRLSIK